MFASAFLAITAAGRGRPQPDEQSPLTRNEISRLLTATITRPAWHADRWPGPAGPGAISAAPGPAIIDGKPPPDNEYHDLQLEYQALPIGNTWMAPAISRTPWSAPFSAPRQCRFRLPA
jgi:hypothetical protein